MKTAHGEASTTVLFSYLRDWRCQAMMQAIQSAIVFTNVDPLSK